MLAAPADHGAFVPGPRQQIPATAPGPLTGLSFVVKDLIDVAGTVTGGGNPDWSARQRQAAASAPVVTRLLQAGANLVGKTVTDELAFSLEGENAHFGTPVNPRCPDRLPGGSSSGSAVAVAAGFADLGLGTDTGGSVRVPASFCGLYGFRPSHGRIPMAGVMPFAPSFDTVGLLARSAEILAPAALCLLGSPRSAVRPCELHLASDAVEIADPQAGILLRQAAKQLGATREISIFAGSPGDYLEAYRVIQGCEIAAAHGDFLRGAQARFGPTIAPRFAGVLEIGAAAAARWRAWREQKAATLRRLLPAGRLLLMPTTPGIAPLRFLRGAEADQFYGAALTLGSVAGLAGLPAISMPVAELDGCPIGLSVLAGPGEDETLLEFVRSLAGSFVPR